MNALHVEAEVLSVDFIARQTFCLRLLAEQICARAEPGQFVMIGPLVPVGMDPFLNRPLSIHRITADGVLELLVAKVGRGTECLAEFAVGQKVAILGPLGRGFCVPEKAERVILVAGGVGVAPMSFLADRALAQDLQVDLLYGAACAAAMVPRDRLCPAGCNVSLASDDGSTGFHGLVTDLLADLLSRLSNTEIEKCYLATCGPMPMMKKVAELARGYSIAAEISMENHMACGVGACMGCTIKTAEKHPRVCVEGPVFAAQEVFG